MGSVHEDPKLETHLLYTGSYMGDHFIGDILNQPLASLINLK